MHRWIHYNIFNHILLPHCSKLLHFICPNEWLPYSSLSCWCTMFTVLVQSQLFIIQFIHRSVVSYTIFRVSSPKTLIGHNVHSSDTFYILKPYTENVACGNKYVNIVKNRYINILPFKYRQALLQMSLQSIYVPRFKCFLSLQFDSHLTFNRYSHQSMSNVPAHVFYFSRQTF